MAKHRRPYSDATEHWPQDKRLYNTFVTGTPGNKREEPVKLTESLYERAQFEGGEEWEARFSETLWLMFHYARNNFQNPASVTGFMNFPPIFEAKMELNAPATILLYGRSVDNIWCGHDDWTLESNMNWYGMHYEMGLLTLKWQRNVETVEEIHERRHLKTGERFRVLSTTRPWTEGGMLERDIVMDIRNELAPQYARSAMHLGFYVGFHYYGHGYPSRSSIDHIETNYVCESLMKLGWPTQYGPDLVPRPPAFHLMLQNPSDIFCYRFNGLVLGENWASVHTLTPLEIAFEMMGEEIIPPTMTESVHALVQYGMDRYRTVDTYVHSKLVYGVEAKFREGSCPDEYPLKEKWFSSIPEQEKAVQEVRKEHPEWLLEGILPKGIM
ncbi:MAG: hypothetical protein ACXQTX_03155 [Candidatus Syntropharchaeia archaeon]